MSWTWSHVLVHHVVNELPPVGHARYPGFDPQPDGTNSVCAEGCKWRK